MKQVLLVFLGGGAGSVLRYLISRAMATPAGFPLGTFSVNILGSLIIGLVMGLSLRNNLLSSNLILLLATGFCGGFTTFSAFALENQALLRSGHFLHFGIYAIGSVVLGVGAIFLGIYLSRGF